MPPRTKKRAGMLTVLPRGRRVKSEEDGATDGESHLWVTGRAPDVE